MNCPNCKRPEGHYSVVEYKPVDDPKKVAVEAYWFCHTCARLVYETDAGFVPEEK